VRDDYFYNMPLKRKYILPLLLPVQLVLLQILMLFPDVVEQYYSLRFYRWMSRGLRTLFGLVPFSVGDLMYLVLLAVLLYTIIKKRKKLFPDLKSSLLLITAWLSGFFLLFNVLWGINYYREPLHYKLQMGTEYSDQQLLDFTKVLIAEVNGIQLKLAADDSSAVQLPYSHDQIFAKNLTGYKQLAGRFEYLRYDVPSNKKSLISVPLSYMGFAGYLNPFTHESQVNALLPLYTFPMVSAHEMAHQIGFASESEANFIGYLATANNPDLYFQYSAYCSALRYCLANWQVRDPKVAEFLLPTINRGILKNFDESREFWAGYESFIETGFHAFYDRFLKLNSQQDGLESYSRFVDLLVNHYHTKGTIR
jgi:hypothetical protein